MADSPQRTPSDILTMRVSDSDSSERARDFSGFPGPKSEVRTGKESGTGPAGLSLGEKARDHLKTAESAEFAENLICGLLLSAASVLGGEFEIVSKNPFALAPGPVAVE